MKFTRTLRFNSARGAMACDNTRSSYLAIKHKNTIVLEKQILSRLAYSCEQSSRQIREVDSENVTSKFKSISGFRLPCFWGVWLPAVTRHATLAPATLLWLIFGLYLH
jgi:hypothetical protein